MNAAHSTEFVVNTVDLFNISWCHPVHVFLRVDLWLQCDAMQIVVAHQMDWELHITQIKFDKWHIISACGIPQAGDSCSGAEMQATHTCFCFSWFIIKTPWRTLAGRDGMYLCWVTYQLVTSSRRHLIDRVFKYTGTALTMVYLIISAWMQHTELSC